MTRITEHAREMNIHSLDAPVSGGDMYELRHPLLVSFCHSSSPLLFMVAVVLVKLVLASWLADLMMFSAHACRCLS